MKTHTFKDLVQMTMTGDEVFYLAEDVGSLIIRKNLLLNEKDARIAELEEFIKVLLPSWPDGEHYPTEMSLLQMQQRRIVELEKFVSEFLLYFSSNNGILVERATIKADTDIVRMARALMERSSVAEDPSWV